LIAKDARCEQKFPRPWSTADEAPHQEIGLPRIPCLARPTLADENRCVQDLFAI